MDLLHVKMELLDFSQRTFNSEYRYFGKAWEFRNPKPSLLQLTITNVEFIQLTNRGEKQSIDTYKIK